MRPSIRPAENTRSVVKVPGSVSPCTKASRQRMELAEKHSIDAAVSTIVRVLIRPGTNPCLMIAVVRSGYGRRDASHRLRRLRGKTSSFSKATAGQEIEARRRLRALSSRQPVAGSDLHGPEKRL